MPYQTPHKGDRASAGDERRVVDQMRQQFTRQEFNPSDLYRPGLSFIAQIEDVLESSGHVFYEWQALAVTYSPTGEATYLETGVLGDNAKWPYLIDIGRSVDDPPVYELGDRVVVTVIDGENGLAYVVNTTSIADVGEIVVDKHYEYLTSDNNTAVVDERNWLGRTVWYSLKLGDISPGPPDHQGIDTANYGGTALVRSHYSGSTSTAAGTIELITVQGAKLYIDQADSGKLKIDFAGAVAAMHDFRITAKGFPILTGTDYIVYPGT